jgi:hypothetical protein
MVPRAGLRPDEAVTAMSCLRFACEVDARPGELPPEEARALAEHLATCDACAARRSAALAMGDLLREAIADEANARDLTEFSDAVLARAGVAARPARTPGAIGGRWPAWLRRRWAAAALVPVLAALALVVYLGRAALDRSPALVEVTAENGSPTILETTDGPIVLLGEDDPAGS